MVQTLKMGDEVGTGELGLVVTIVEHPLGTDPLGEVGGHLPDERPMLAGEGEGDLETFVGCPWCNHLGDSGMDDKRHAREAQVKISRPALSDIEPLHEV